MAPPGAPLPLFDPPPPPAPDEQRRILEKSREVALQYTASLPDFICTETVVRYGLAKGAWKQRDTLTVGLAYSEKGEQYRLLAIGGRPTTKSLNSVGGFRSNGEFGSLLKWIFHPESATSFEWERWTNLRRQRLMVFSYRIDREHSHYNMNFTAFSEAVPHDQRHARAGLHRSRNPPGDALQL